MAASKKTILMNNEQLRNIKNKIEICAKSQKKKKKTYIKVYTDWANDDYTTTYKDVDCWIRVLTLRLSLRP